MCVLWPAALRVHVIAISPGSSTTERLAVFVLRVRSCSCALVCWRVFERDINTVLLSPSSSSSSLTRTRPLQPTNRRLPFSHNAMSHPRHPRKHCMPCKMLTKAFTVSYVSHFCSFDSKSDYVFRWGLLMLNWCLQRKVQRQKWSTMDLRRVLIKEKQKKNHLSLDYEKMSEYSEGVFCWPDVSAELMPHTWFHLTPEQAVTAVLHIRFSIRKAGIRLFCASLTGRVGVIRLWLGSVVLLPQQTGGIMASAVLNLPFSCHFFFFFEGKISPLCDFVMLMLWSIFSKLTDCIHLDVGDGLFLS